MVIIDNGLNRVRDLINTDVDRGQLGTGTTAVYTDDTDLETADANTIIAPSVTVADKQLTWVYTLPTTSGTHAAYTEFKLFSTANSKNYDRVVMTAIDFTWNGTEEIVISKSYFIRRV